MSQIKVKITGIAGLIMSNPVPFMDIYSDIYKSLKVANRKRNKLEADKEEVDRLTYLGCLYLNENDQIIIPARMIKGVLVSAARKFKLGKQIQGGIFVAEDSILNYGETLSIEQLWSSEKYKRKDMYLVQRARIMKIKPYFRNWNFETSLVYNDDIISKEDIVQILKRGEMDVGFGDFRPEYGRFKFEIIE